MVVKIGHTSPYGLDIQRWKWEAHGRGLSLWHSWWDVWHRSLKLCSFKRSVCNLRLCHSHKDSMKHIVSSGSALVEWFSSCVRVLNSIWTSTTQDKCMFTFFHLCFCCKTNPTTSLLLGHDLPAERRRTELWLLLTYSWFCFTKWLSP